METLVRTQLSEEVSDRIYQAFKENLDSTYSLVWTDYNDDYEDTPEIFQKCMNRCDTEPLDDNDWVYDVRYENSLQELKTITDKILSNNSNNQYSHIKKYVKTWLEQYKDDVIDLIIERDDSDPVKEMISRTRLRGRATLFSNYECLAGNYDLRNTYCYDEYFKDIVDVLYLNPALVKKTFNEFGINTIGKWPNRAYRNGKEAVLYKEFAEEMANQCCYGVLTFMGMLPLTALYKTAFQPYRKILIPKGNKCGMFNSWNGSGSLMEMELQRDLIIPVIFPKKTRFDCCSVCVDERKCNNGYCIDEVYGLMQSVWKKEFQFIY